MRQRDFAPRNSDAKIGYAPPARALAAAFGKPFVYSFRTETGRIIEPTLEGLVREPKQESMAQGVGYGYQT